MVVARLIVVLFFVCVVNCKPQREVLLEVMQALKTLGYDHNNVGPQSTRHTDRYTYNGDPMTDVEIIPGQVNNYGKYSYGCKDGYCWVQCDSFPVVVSWCWATPPYSHSQSYSYVRCNTHSDCSNRFQCATPCIG